MHDPEATARLIEPDRAHLTWSTQGDDVAAMERHATEEGCSLCARALVNDREMAVSLATSAPEATRPSRASDPRRLLANDLAPSPNDLRRALPAALRERLRATQETRRNAANERAKVATSAGAGAHRILDASASVAHRQIRLPGEAARIRDIDELLGTTANDIGRALPRADDGSARLLEQLSRFVDFEYLFVSIVRGERVAARTQRGLDEATATLRELRREMSYCTHCVSGEVPLVIENALVEPFFRGNKAATRFGIAAYLGVPLRSARGVVLGTLCALSPRPRPIDAETVRLVEVLARRAIAELERDRTPALRGALIERSSERADLYTESFFRDLVAAEHARPMGRRASALLAARAEKIDAALDWLEAGETAGRLGPSTIGLLLPGIGAEGAASRFARLEEVAGADAIGLAMADASTSGAVDWIARATSDDR